MGLLDKLKNKTEKPVDMAIYAPLTGEIQALSEVNDPVFAQEMMGPGLAIYPTVGKVYAPCDGEVLTVFRTKHAITFKGLNGAEIIVHVGLETVGLDGQHFDAHVTDGQKVNKGDLLLTFDLEAIKQAGFDLITPVIVTNANDYTTVVPAKSGPVVHGESFINLEK